MLDLRIEGATVIDGTGAPRFLADVGVRDDAIAAVGDLARAAAGVVLPARGLALAPGFIGRLVIKGGEHTGSLPGRVLRRA